MPAHCPGGLKIPSFVVAKVAYFKFHFIFNKYDYFFPLQGPGGVWCDVDVVEFSYFGAPNPAPKEQLYTEIVDDLRGSDLCIGSGSQVGFCFSATNDLKARN